MSGWKMKDIKIITVVLGYGGILSAIFDETTGELRLYPNKQAKISPDNATFYALKDGCIQWSVADNPTELEGVKREGD